MTDENFICCICMVADLGSKDKQHSFIQNYPRPKAGVFAVRQGKPLFNNLTRIFSGQKLKPYYPQKNYLSLIGTGDKKVIASWSNLGFYSPFLWQLNLKIILTANLCSNFCIRIF